MTTDLILCNALFWLKFKMEQQSFHQRAAWNRLVDFCTTACDIFFLLLKNNDLLTISELFRKWNRCWLSQSKYRTPASTTCATVITFLVFCVYVLGQIQSLCCSTMTVILCIGVLSNLFSFEQCWKCWISPKCNKCIDGELSRGPLEINVKRT